MIAKAAIQRAPAKFIEILESSGELRRVSEPTDWRFEVAEATRLEQHSSRGGRKALLFESIRDYPGCSILTNGLGTVGRICLALGLDKNAGIRELAREMKRRIAQPPAPEMVSCDDTGFVCLEGDDVDVNSLPVPLWHRRETSRYIGTWHVNITKDPESKTRNAGVYRMMILDKKRITVSAGPSSHLGLHLKRADLLGKPLPMAVAIGVAEPVVIAAAAAFGKGSDELHQAGGLMQTPLNLMQCRTIDCEVPADSEIVLEGEIEPRTRVADGPFFDYAGVLNVNPCARVFRVKRMRVARQPVFRGAAIGLPGAEDHVLYSLLARLGLADFHGGPAKRTVQSFLFRMQWYGLLQITGRLGAAL